MKLPNARLLSLMLDAYGPCLHFGNCREAQWNPESGQIPRGFVGAIGELDEVELVMVFSEPGKPHDNERYDTKSTPLEFITEATNHAYDSFKNGKDLFHRNVRWFVSQLYPDLTFDEQLRRVWLTEGRLCSIANEIGGTKDRTCASNYLVRQLELLPNATAVAFGGKAKDYLRGLGVNHFGAYALAPPGANHKPARPSWEAAIEVLRARRVGA